MKEACIAISGADPSCGAGNQLDIRVLSRLGVRPLSVISALTVQGADQVKDSWEVPQHILSNQINLICLKYKPKAAKIGMIGENCLLAILQNVEDRILNMPLVLDPVIQSSSGFKFIKEEHLVRLFKHCYLVTPNIPEMEVFLNRSIEGISQMEEGLKTFSKEFGCQRILLKGGHLPLKGLDILYNEGRIVHLSSEAEYLGPEIHGTGCFLSSAIAGYISLGLNLEASIKSAKKLLYDYMLNAVRHEREKRAVFSFS